MKYKQSKKQNQRIQQITELTLVVGADIAKKTHVARAVDFRGIEIGKDCVFGNDHSGLTKLVSWMKELQRQYAKTDIILGIEPTGHYWFPLAEFLHRENIKVVIVNPHHVNKSKELEVFGLCHLLGFRFAPRLRDLSDSRLYSFDKVGDFPKIENLLRGRINTKIIQENFDDVLRLAHSIREGKVSGSLIMGKIGSYARQNSLATALREMGRIEKTIFILDYISSESMRRRIQRGLNKGEAMNALARALFFGKRGELRERALQDQLQRASALNILINAISVWNTVYLTEATKLLKQKGSLQENLLSHISPLGWEHINFLGEYTFDQKRNADLRSLLPLIQGKIEAGNP